MNTLIITSIGIIIGVISTILVSRYYFNRSIKTELTPYLDFSNQLLKGIDPDVRSDLSIKYQEQAVDDLFQAQFLIANTGENPIKKPIHPLTLAITEDAEILDVSLLHISPEGRDVSHETAEDKKSITFNFPLLNSKEFFIFKILAKGSLNKENIQFSITSEDLPPKLETQTLPFDMLTSPDTKNKSGFEIGFFIAGIIFLLFSFSPIYLSTQVTIDWPSFSIFSPHTYLLNLEFLHLAKFAAGIVFILSLLFSVGLIMIAFEDLQFPYKQKFTIPHKIYEKRRNTDHSIDALIHASEELKANKTINDTPSGSDGA